MKLEKGERKNGGGVVGRWKELPTHLGEMDDDQRHFCFYSQHQHSECFIYPMPAEGECVIHSTCPLFSFLFFLQELIEVDSEVVFELASYILQVRLNVCVCLCVYAWVWACVWISSLYDIRDMKPNILIVLGLFCNTFLSFLHMFTHTVSQSGLDPNGW